MSEEVVYVTGRVTDLATRRGLEGLRVEAWDREGRREEALGAAETDAEGTFAIPLDPTTAGRWAAQRGAEAIFRVLRDERLLWSTEESVVWSPGDTEEVLIELDSEAVQREPWLQVGSFEELMEHEGEILERIAEMPKGGNLFMAHPLMLLRDIGVQLSPEAVQELLEREPHLSALSPQPYLALKRTQEEQRIRFHLQGLFQGGER